LKQLADPPGLPDLVSYRKNTVEINGKEVELTTDIARGNFLIGLPHFFGSAMRGAKASASHNAAT
jgi:hypothetical protein